jgi:hypothetical protein
MKPNDYDSIPSDIEDDQWAEIQKYDFNQFLREQEKTKKDNKYKR